MFKRKRLSIFIFFIIVAAFFPLRNFMRNEYVVPIAMYHSVNPDAQLKNRLAVRPENFRRQMNFLRAGRYNVLGLEELAELVKKKKKIPPRTIAITFDDGYKDNYLYAFEILKEYRIPATIFVIINEIGRPDRLSWDEIKEMQDSGLVTFGSHALGPEPLVNIESVEQLKKEIFDSKKILQNRLNRKVASFSYPEGRFNSQIRSLVKDAGYKVAVATSPGRRFADDDPFALKRLRISGTSDNLFVFWIETSGYYIFIKENRDDD